MAGFLAASKNADAAYDKLAVAAGSGDLAAVDRGVRRRRQGLRRLPRRSIAPRPTRLSLQRDERRRRSSRRLFLCLMTPTKERPVAWGTTGLLDSPWLGWVGKRRSLGVWEGGFVVVAWLGHRHGLYGNGERLQHDGLGGEAPGARRMDRRQAKLLAHVHPAVETESEIERVEHEIARRRDRDCRARSRTRPRGARAAACAAGRRRGRRPARRERTRSAKCHTGSHSSNSSERSDTRSSMRFDERRRGCRPDGCGRRRGSPRDRTRQRRDRRGW